MLRIKFSDLLLATLTVRSGNEGWFGVSPRGDAYHIVVPVDTQIARGVMACNRPTDGTPFGGYANWLYFRCPPCEYDGDDQVELTAARMLRAGKTADNLTAWLAQYGIEGTIADSRADMHEPARAGEVAKVPGSPMERIRGQERRRSGWLCSCTGCGKSWDRLGAFLGDDEVKFEQYKACLDDFLKGAFVFAHRCGQSVAIPVTRFARPRNKARNLAGTHACPGMCYHESSLAPCSAVCEGSTYRRVAQRLRTS